MVELDCRTDRRRHLIRDVGLNGLDHVEVGPDQRSLTIHFLAKAPEDVTSRNVRVDGGRRVRDLRVTDVRVHRTDDPETDDAMVVTLDRAGDFSTYRLRLVETDEQGRPGHVPLAGFDPRYASLDVRFKVDCPSDLDCAVEPDCSPSQLLEPEIDYLAKDYASFRRLILDRLALVMPAWEGRHVPDLGIALVELMAYVGDQLSYHQDAVATEAYLDTARLRVSVRRHARLVDYLVHEGCNARAWVCIETDTDVTLPADVAFVTGLPAGPPSGGILRRRELAQVPLETYETFLPVQPREQPLIAAHNRIRLHTWGDVDCCLPRGARSATLVDTAHEPPNDEDRQGAERPPRALKLGVGDVLILEEVRGPRTGEPADADPTRRHAVRITGIELADDPVTGDRLLEVSWGEEDALPFALCISSKGPPPACEPLEDVSVVRGNVVLVDHGRWVRNEGLGEVPVRRTAAPCSDEACGCAIRHVPGRYRPRLTEGPLTFRHPVTQQDSARALAGPQDPRGALPHLDVRQIPLAAGGATTLFAPGDLVFPDALVSRLLEVEAGDDAARELLDHLSPTTRELLENEPGGDTISSALRAWLLDDLHRLLRQWHVRSDLLSSGADDPHLVAEVNDEGIAQLRLGDGVLGREPQANASFVADYRVGNGPAGNVGAETINRIVLDDQTLGGVRLCPRNPLPARGGASPEPLTDVKLRAPCSFRRQLVRAVTAADYAELAGRHPAVQRAAATLHWTGSWTQVRVAIDAYGGSSTPGLLAEVAAGLEPYRRVLHDVTVVPATMVPLRVALLVCVRGDHLRGPVEVALRRRLGSGRDDGGHTGFFHPDNVSFGTDIHLSQLIAAASIVPGVESVEVTAVERLDTILEADLDAGVLRLGPSEVPSVADDPDFPDRGRLELTLEGGR